MTTTRTRATHVLLERLGTGATVLLAVLLELPTPPTWGDGVDAQGRTVLLVGQRALGESETARGAMATFASFFEEIAGR